MRRFYSLILCAAFAVNIAGCTATQPEQTDKDLFVIGFSQVGSESDWRIANTQSMIDTFTEDKGYELRVVNARQNQDNQFAAVRNFILEGVDFIVIAPTVEEGWDSVLAEVKAAGIPVIIMDRSVSVTDDSLYLSNIGSDFLYQGTMAAGWLDKQEDIDNGDGTLEILHLQGTYGATAQILRTLAENTDIDVLYSENDNMTFGAMRAMDDAGITYGEDGQVTIITFDATREALQYCLDGDIALCVECNPLIGPILEGLISTYRQGYDMSRQVYVPEFTYTKEDLTQSFIDSRCY